MHIKEVAEKLNTTSRAIRFYEQKELICPKKEKENDYRYFTEIDLMRLNTILVLREVGFSLNTIKKLLEDPNMNMRKYLDLQRAALFKEWLELKDMIDTIDQMMDRTNRNIHMNEEIFGLGMQLNRRKKTRKNWQDKWDFDGWAEEFESHIKKEGFHFNVHRDYDEALNKVVNTIQLNPGDVCLDIGIGTGNLGSRFLDKGIKVIGVDQSDKMLEACKQKHPMVEIRKGHFLALPLTDNFVDGIVSSYALHHLPDEEKLLALAEMDRVLKPNGKLCIADLMFVDRTHRNNIMETYRMNENVEAIESIEDEYYADRSLLVKWLSKKNYQVETYQFNDILSMIYARK